ncbi:T-lymphocyte activation antigen CD80 isoform X2 [Dicentrarchus labrax]|uniref:T-lymphocyte activation antigen CD80 isoform X2 n=1 Tax=Dicentrarchus labrax TaxID=13489 RepID=UPI0021F54606|nr:T-lymphocyte activation antigen CD80 isoform X2 [Dicentrarchus labrax]
MNMASIGFICIFSLIFISAGTATTNAFIKVQCKTENVGRYGQQSLLECVVDTTQEDVTIRVVTWKKDNKTLLVFNKEEITKQQPGYMFAEPSWNKKNMNISLLIDNTGLKDEGDYVCAVMTDSGTDDNKTRLKVRAKYKKPTINSVPETVTENADSTLVCISSGGYPEGRLSWFDEHNVEWVKSAQMEAKKTESGLFELSSKLPLLRGSTFSKYTCVVYNASGDKEDEVTFEIPPKKEELGGEKGINSASKIVAPLVVIGSLIAGLLLVVIVYRRRSQQARRHSTAPLMSDHQAVPYIPGDEAGFDVNSFCR